MLNEMQSLKLNYNEYVQFIDKFKIHFYQEFYIKCLETLEELKKQNYLENNDLLYINLLEINLFIHQNNTQDALNHIDKLRKDYNFDSTGITKFLLDILESYSLVLNRNNEENLKLILKTEIKFNEIIKIQNIPSNFINEILSIIAYIKGINNRENKKYEESIKYFNECVNLRKGPNNDEQGLPLYLIARSYLTIGKYNLSIEYFEKSLQFFQNISFNGQIYKNSNKIFGVYNNIGTNYWKLGKLNEALSFYLKALETSAGLNDRLKSMILANLGLIFWEKGELDNSLVYNRRSLEILEKSNNKPFLSIVLNNIANLYQNKGEINSALRYYDRALKISEDISNKSQYASILNNIAELYQSKSDFQRSYEIYKQSLEIFTNLQSKLEISFIFHNLINISLYLQNEKEASEYLTELEKIKIEDKEKTKIIKQTYILSVANIKKFNKRFVDLGEAQKYYNEIIHDDVVKHGHTVESILQLCEILLLELKFSGKEVLLTELTDLIDELYNIAKKQNNFLLLCHSYILLSKISILNFDPENIDRAKQLLIANRKMAEERGFNNVANRLALEIESQQRSIDKINATDKTKITFDLLLELTEIENYVSKTIKQTIISLPIDIEDEIPRLILLIARSGISFYSYSFGNFETYDSSLISGFLTALNTFFQETFETETPIERITQKDYTILFRSIDQVTFCYVFTGQSLKAVTKFEKFISVMISSEEFQGKTKDALTSGRSFHDDPWMEKQISGIFENN